MTEKNRHPRTGTADFVKTEGDELIVVDYKAGNAPILRPSKATHWMNCPASIPYTDKKKGA